MSVRLATVLALSTLLATVAAHAQQNGNTYNGVHNQPTLGGVRSKEDAAGVAPAPQEQHQETTETDQLYHKLMTDEGKSGKAASPAGDVPNSEAVPAAR